MTIRPIQAADLEAIDGLAADVRRAPLRYLDRFGLQVAAADQAERMRRAIVGSGVALLSSQGGTVVAAAAASSVEDLASHFDHPVHEIGPVLVPGDAPDRANVARSLLTALVEQVTTVDPGLVFVRLEADDPALVEGAQRAGFVVRETSLTFVNDLERKHLNPPYVDPGTVRVHRFATDGDLDPTLRSLIERGGQMSADHYHTDPRLPDERCDALYQRLARRVAAGDGADVLVMRFLDEQLVGFGSWRRWTDLDPFGASIVGSSFGFRVEGAPPGNLTAVAEHVCNRPIVDNRLLEWSTQATNYSMVNMLCRQPSIRLCRTTQVLHRWTDEG